MVSQIFAQSDPFEIKPLGSAYPAAASPSAGPSASQSGSGSGAAPSATGGSGTTKNSAVSNLKNTLVGFASVAAAALGFAFA